jgi:hypothetical protein
VSLFSTHTALSISQDHIDVLIAVRIETFKAQFMGIIADEPSCPFTKAQLIELEKMIDADVESSPPLGNKFPVIVIDDKMHGGKPYTRLDMTLDEITKFEVYEAKLALNCPGESNAYKHWTQVRKRAMCNKYVRDGATLRRRVINNKAVFRLELGDIGVETHYDAFVDYVPLFNELTLTLSPKDST